MPMANPWRLLIHFSSTSWPIENSSGSLSWEESSRPHNRPLEEPNAKQSRDIHFCCAGFSPLLPSTSPYPGAISTSETPLYIDHVLQNRLDPQAALHPQEQRLGRPERQQLGRSRRCRRLSQTPPIAQPQTAKSRGSNGSTHRSPHQFCRRRKASQHVSTTPVAVSIAIADPRRSRQTQRHVGSSYLLSQWRILQPKGSGIDVEIAPQGADQSQVVSRTSGGCQGCVCRSRSGTQEARKVG